MITVPEEIKNSGSFKALFENNTLKKEFVFHDIHFDNCLSVFALHEFIDKKFTEDFFWFANCSNDVELNYMKKLLISSNPEFLLKFIENNKHLNYSHWAVISTGFFYSTTILKKLFQNFDFNYVVDIFPEEKHFNIYRIVTEISRSNKNINIISNLKNGYIIQNTDENLSFEFDSSFGNIYEVAPNLNYKNRNLRHEFI